MARTGSKCSLFGQVSRRSFLGRAGVLTATGVVTGVMSPLVSSARKGNIVLAQDKVRRVRSFRNVGNCQVQGFEPYEGMREKDETW